MMEIGTEGDPFVTEPVADPFEVPEPTREAPAPVERPTKTPMPLPEKVPA